MIDAVIIVILVLIASAIGFYIYNARRKGVKCIGCPYAKQCGGKCGCGLQAEEKSEDDRKDGVG